MTLAPTATDPVKVTMSTSGFELSSTPASLAPMMRLATPAGYSISSII